MSKPDITPQGSASSKRSFNWSNPKRTPKPLSWFRKRGYTQVPLDLMCGQVTYIHPNTNTALNKYGRQLTLQLVPLDRHMKTKAKYLKFNRERGGRYLAHIKYLTFIGSIPEGYTIDHIDGNPLNNYIGNLRAIPDEINRRDGGFMRKLRNHGINVAMYPGIILEGYERMARFKETHTQSQYQCLTRTELLQIFLGDDYRIDTRSSDEIMLHEITHHMEI